MRPARDQRYSAGDQRRMRPAGDQLVDQQRMRPAGDQRYSAVLSVLASSFDQLLSSFDHLMVSSSFDHLLSTFDHLLVSSSVDPPTDS